MGVKRNLLYFVALIFLASCFKDSYDFENVSGRIKYSPSIAAPLAKGNLSIENLYEFSDSSDLDIVGNTIVYTYRKDSLFSFDVSDFGRIPEQRKVDFHIKSSVDIPPELMSDNFDLDKVDSLVFSFDNDMRLDSFVLNTGVLTIDASSTFRHTGFLIITSDNIIDESGETFSKTIQISNASGTFSSSDDYFLDNNKLTLSYDGEDNFILINFDVFLVKTDDNGILSDEEVRVDFTFHDLNDYKGIFGYMGVNEQTIDTIIESPLVDFENLIGTFAITNPKLSLAYSNSLGVPFGLDLNLVAGFDNGSKVTINKENLDFNSSAEYLNPLVEGEISLSREEIHNIDSFLVLPPASTFDILFSAISNEDGDLGIPNFILKDSKLNIDLEVEVPLEFRADLVFTDTLKNLNMDMNIDDIEYANLYYTIKNEFPVNLGVALLAYDIETNSIIDTVELSPSGETALIIAAPVDENGITIKDLVEPYRGYISLTNDEAKNLFNKADEIIMQAFISSTEGTSSVKILKDYTINFDMAIEAQATVVTGSDN